MKNLSDLVRRSVKKSRIEAEVDEEFRFHIDTQAHDYESRGLSHDEAREMAEARFGDVARIKKECLRISYGKSVLIWILNSVFMFSLVMGLFLRVLVPESHVNRVGDVMMMIGGLGILLVYAKQAGSMVFKSSATPFRLGLKTESPPVSFDEQGRTPFDRVRTDDQ